MDYLGLPNAWMIGVRGYHRHYSDLSEGGKVRRVIMPTRIEQYVQAMADLRARYSMAWVLPIVEGRQRFRALMHQKYLRRTSLAGETSCLSLFLAVARDITWKAQASK